MPSGPAWLVQDDERLIGLWNAGLSARQIAERTPGRTRSSVIGRVSRLRNAGKLQSRPQDLVRSTGPRKAAPPPAPRLPPKPPPPQRPMALMPADSWSAGPPEARKPPLRLKPDALTPTARPFVEREAGQCKWPFERADGWWLCCAPQRGEGPYCAQHHAIAHPVARPARKRAPAAAERLAA